MPTTQDPQISATLAALADTLERGLLAVYLHGSAVSGGLAPQSDIDLLAVTDRSLTDHERTALLDALLRLSARHPRIEGGPRCLEVMVFTRSDLADPTFPARADFTYGEWLRDGFMAGSRPAPTRDPEHTLVLALAAQQAQPLLGPDPRTLLPKVSALAVRRALNHQLPVLLEGLGDDTRNVLLTLARMWHTAATGAFTTKDRAAEWASLRLGADHAQLLGHARRAYLGQIADDWSRNRDAARCLADHLAAELRQSLAADH